MNYMFLETYPFLLGCQICWHINYSQYSLMVLCISAGLVEISLLSLRILIWVLSLFFVSLARGLSIFFILSKNQLLVLWIFSCRFLIYFIFLWSLFSSFFWLSVLFVLPFLILLSGKLGCLFEIFLVFLKKACIAMNFPLRSTSISLW